MSLEKLREKIDSIDAQLIRLYRERLEVVQDVAEYKRVHHLPVLHQNRETEVLDKVAREIGIPYQEQARALYTAIMDISKTVQYEQLKDGGALSQRLKQAVCKIEDFTRPGVLVACQGVEGAYSNLACERMFNSPQIHFCETFSEVFEMVMSGEVQYGVLPIENSTAGSVVQVYDLMERYDFTIIKCYRFKVSHNLMAKSQADFAKLHTVLSHPQALSQCSRFFEQHPTLKPKEFENTAMAAKYVSESADSGLAAIASKESAEKYGLKILQEDIQNSGRNFTRFICISNKLRISEDADKISVALKLRHEPGSLYRLLARFALNGLNLDKIESRPIVDTDFEFLFYFDFEGNVTEPKISRMLDELERDLEYFEFIGNYREER